jgi:chemotaxis family two-component system sensor kinase Cph1
MWLFDTSPFVPRWLCGSWEPWLGNMVIWSDWAFFAAYMGIPWIIYYNSRRWGMMGHPAPRWLTFLFMGFILLCGFSHAIDAIVFYVPVYRLFAFERLVGAVFSVGTMFALVYLCRNIEVRWKGPEGKADGRTAE